VDGAYGRLFGVSDSVTGTIFSVNDAAGLPVIEVESNLTDKITMGTYGTNTLVVDNVSVGIGTGTPSGKLHIVDATLAGTGFLSGSALNIQQTWNTSGAPTAIKLNVIDTASTGTSNLMDLQVGGVSKFKVRKDGWINANSLISPSILYFGSYNQEYQAGLYIDGDFRSQKIRAGLGNNSPSLAADGDHIFAQRNGLAPQESRIYGTYTNATNFERLNLKYNSTDSAFQIGTEKGFSGTARPLQLQTDGATRMTLSTGGNVGIGTTTPDTKLYVVGKLAVNNSVLGGKALDVYTAEAGSAATIQSNGLTNGDGILQLVSPSSSGVAYALRGSVQSNGAGIITIQQNGVGDAVLEALSMSAGDSMSRYLINGGASYSVGIDNSDSDKFKISNSSVLGSNDRLVIDASGLHVIGNIKASGILTNNGITDPTFTRITNPGGGTCTTQTTSITGAIAITFPVGMTNTMLRMTIKVYNYATSESFEIHCGGYNYLPGPNAWFNTFAYIVGQPNINRNFTTRFGYTSGGKSILYIGELASTWSYPQVFITEVQCGFGGLSQDFTSGWTVGFTTAAFENVTQTISNVQIGQLSTTTPAALGTAAVGTSTTVARADHVHAAPTTVSGNAGTATTLQTARLINGVSFNGSADITVPAAAGTLTGAIIASGVTGSSLTSVGTLGSLTVASGLLVQNGKVGIGTSTPSARLHVAGGDTSLGFTAASLALGFSTTATYPHFIHTRHNAGTPVSNAIDFYTSNGTEAGVYPSNAIHALTLTNSRVGIGTTDPNAKLSIVETSLAVGAGQTGSALDIQQTWSSDGSPTAIKLNVTNTNSAAASKLMDLQVSGVSKFKVGKGDSTSSNFSLGSNGGDCTFTAGGNLLTVGVGSHDIQLGGSLQVVRSNAEAATYFLGHNDTSTSIAPSLRKETNHILSQRNGINPQAYRLYNTYTSDTNFERLNFRWDSSVAKIGTNQGASSGLARDLVLETSGTERVRITASGLFSADGVSLGKGRAGIATNIAIGQSTLVKNISGSYNLAIGRNSLAENTNGSFNVAIGEASLRYSTDGSYNIAIGQNALISEQGSYTVAIGQNALSNSSNGNYNVVMGHESLGSAIDSSSNVVIGYHAGLYDVAAGSVDYLYNSVCIGTEASFYGPYGDNNSIAIGYSARGMGDNSAVFGNDSITNTYLKGTVQIPRLAANPFDSERIAMRWNGLTGTIGTSAVGTGLARDLVLETSGTERVRITAGGLFSANGVSLGKGGGNITSNLALGASSLNSNVSGYSNLGIGANSLYSNQNGTYNISLGENSLYDITGGSSNIVIGTSAGTLTAPGELAVKNINSSILIGNFASTYGNLTDTNCIAIGDSVNAMASNSVVLGNDNVTNTYLKGAVQIHRSTPLNPVVYERIAMRWNGTTGTIGTSQTGAGTFARALALETNGTARMTIATGGNISNSALFSTSGFAYTGIAPATTGAPGVSGEMAFSANFLYRHNGTNWQRTGISFANW
jgi:hypothetical protein